MVDATNAYWTNSVSPAGVMMVPLSGGTPVSLASGSDPLGIAVDTTYVYWADYNANTVNEVSLGGGPPVTLVSGQSGANGMASDETSLYWTNDLGGTVMKLAK